MGRKKRHPNPLSIIDSEATREAVKEVFHGWGPTAVANGLTDFLARKSYKEIEEEKFVNAGNNIAPETIGRYMKGENSLNGWSQWTFFLWMTEDYGNVLKEKQIEEIMNKKEPLVRAVKDAFGFGEHLEMNSIKPLIGSYELFRPSFMKPDKDVMICRLDIGFEDTSPFGCRLISSYRSSGGNPVTDTYVGKIVPYGERMMAIMTSLSNATNFRNPANASLVMHLDEIERSTVEPVITEIGGIILTALGSYRASAWPIYARRMTPIPPEIDQEAFQSRTVSLADNPGIPEGAVNAFARGIVNWQHQPPPMEAPSP